MNDPKRYSGIGLPYPIAAGKFVRYSDYEKLHNHLIAQRLEVLRFAESVGRLITVGGTQSREMLSLLPHTTAQANKWINAVHNLRRNIPSCTPPSTK